MFKIVVKKIAIVLIVAIFLGAFSVLVYEYFFSGLGVAQTETNYKTKYETKDEYVRFDMEIYDIVIDEYWDIVDESKFADLYKLALEKATNSQNIALESKDREGVAKMIFDKIGNLEDTVKKEIALNIGQIVLYNLYPLGRSGLQSKEQESQFRDTVNNVDRSKNLYSMLSLEDNVSIQEVEKSFEDQKKILEKSEDPNDKIKLEELSYAHKVLTDQNTKEIYDEHKIEPTAQTEIIENEILFLDLSQITPATFNEAMNALNRLSTNSNISGLIIDLRGNIGGSLDFAKYFAGLFLGPNQYAFDLWRKGEPHAERTPLIQKIDALKNITDTAILVSESTQSTAELTTSIFKRFKLGAVVGTKTKGWGTVENTYPIKTTFNNEESYMVLLVNNLTLREDGEPIEENGILPDIDTKQENLSAKLVDRFNSRKFIKILEYKINN